MADPSPIVQTNPQASYLEQQADIDAAMARVMRSGTYLLGPELEALETEFASYVGSPYAIGVASGTDALEIALRACGIGPGDAVFTVAHTAVATVAAIERCGATPVLVDIDPARYTMAPDSLDDALSDRSLTSHAMRAVIPVHLYGQPADIRAICSVAQRHGVQVIEDCAQAHGAALGNRKVGTFGDLATFSFYPTKNLGTFGDAGMVLCAHPQLAQQVASLRQYGWGDTSRMSDRPGVNSRLDEIHAAILRVRLRQLEGDNQRRRAIATSYSQEMAVSQLTLPVTADDTVHAFHQYVVRAANRDSLCAHLRLANIGTGIHYPVPVHRQPAYAGRITCASDLVHTEQAAREVLSLPMFPQLTSDQIERVVTSCRQWRPDESTG